MALTALLAVYPLVRSFAWVQVNYNEGWNLYWQNRAMHGLRLYSGAPPTMFCNYPPLSFYLIALLGKTGANMLVAARLVSLAALGFVAWASAFAVRQWGGSRVDAVLSGVALTLPMLVFYDSYVGSNDPQLLGMALAGGALALHLAGPPTLRRSIAIAALLVACGLTKHNLVALPAAIAVDLLWGADRRVRVVFLLAGLGIVLAAVGAIVLREDAAFFYQVLASRTWSAARALGMAQDFLTRHQATFMVGGIGLVVLRGPGSRLVLTYLGFALAIAGYFSGGAGTAENIWFDMLAALAIGAGLVAARLRERGAGQAMLAAVALGATLAPLIAAPRALDYASAGLLGGLSREAQAFAADAAFIRERPGPALCESILLCIRAGKPITVDPFNVFQATRTGRLPGSTLTAAIDRQYFTTIDIRSPRGAESDRFRNFGIEVYDAIGRAYRPLETGKTGTISVPRD